jgi:hypothetical protein
MFWVPNEKMENQDTKNIQIAVKKTGKPTKRHVESQYHVSSRRNDRAVDALIRPQILCIPVNNSNKILRQGSSFWSINPNQQFGPTEEECTRYAMPTPNPTESVYV